VVKVPRHVVTQNQVIERKWKRLDQANRKGVKKWEKLTFHRKAQITKKQQWNEIL
jgi:hypothetical protein